MTPQLSARLLTALPQLLGHRDQEFTHPEDRESDVDAAWEILNGKRNTHQTEKRFLRPDGSVRWVLANLTFLRDDAGRPLSWVGQSSTSPSAASGRRRCGTWPTTTS